MEQDLASAQRIVTVALNLTLAVLVGASAAQVWLRSARSAWGKSLVPRLRSLMRVALPLAMAAYVTLLWLEAASMAELPVAEALPAVRSVLTATHYGLAWMAGAAALLVAGVALHTRSGKWPGARAPLVCAAALGVFLYARSSVSHAGAAGDFTWAVLLDWIHLVLVSLWVGEVIVAGLVTLRAPPEWESKNRAECARFVASLSTSATLALAGIFVTGTLNAWRGLGSMDNAAGNPYATILTIKIALVLCAAALGGLNRFIVMPQLLAQLQRPSPNASAQRRFALVLQVEACFLVAALAAAAVLSSTSPPTAL